METREIGKSGIRASVIGLGCNNFGFFQDPAQATGCIHAALDAGITFFDMASEHGQGAEEALVGAALGARRKDVVIATKFGQQELIGVGPDGELRFSQDTSRQGASRRWIVESVEESLKRLRTDYIDLYQPHVLDADAPPDEMMRALDDLVSSGKVRAIGLAANQAGVSDLASLQTVARDAGLTSFVSMQAHYNMIVREAEAEIIPALRAQGMSLLPYWPLANGVLTGKYRQGAPDPAGSRFAKIPMVKGLYAPDQWEAVERLRSFANARGMSMVELAFAWLLAEPVVACVIAGASKPEQVRQNAAAADVKLSEAVLSELNALLSRD